MTTEEVKTLDNIRNEMENIVRNHSIFAVSIEFRETILEIAKKYGWASCTACNSGLYIAVTRVYNAYLDEKKKEDEIRKFKHGEKRQKSTKRDGARTTDKG